jgi:hypothetical protein
VTLRLRSQAEQLAGLAIVAAKVPEASIVVPTGYLDTPALRHGDREAVFAVGRYDIWTAGGGELLMTDLSADEAARELYES